MNHKRSIVKSKTPKIQPSDLEALLLKYSALNDLVVIDTPLPDSDDARCVFVAMQVNKTGKTVTEKEVLGFVDEKGNQVLVLDWRRDYHRGNCENYEWENSSEMRKRSARVQGCRRVS